MTETAHPPYERALAFAAEAHSRRHQPRKGTNFPYVSHPIRVAEILRRFGCDEAVVVAGFLHDTLEDTDVTADDLRRKFDDRVTQLVLAVSEPDKSLPWKTRKEHTLAHLERETDAGVLALMAADKLDNVRSIADSLRSSGREPTWRLFKTGERDQRWYYRSVVDILLAKDPASSLFRTLDFETHGVFPETGQRTNFFAGKPLRTPHDARAYLADPIKHWRPDHSALELATAWIGGGGIPATVDRVLGTSDAFADCRLVEAFFEREVELETPGRASQTDILALVATLRGYGVIAVEGKARETFGDLVSKWNVGAGKQTRLENLCGHLGLDPRQVGELRYQLLHRTVSALHEAQRYGATDALMLVHSFDPNDSSFDDYQRFAAALGLAGAEIDTVTEATIRDGVSLRLAWVKER